MNIKTEIRTVMANLPNDIKGFSIETPDGWTTIVLNQNLSHEKNKESYLHELDHIKNDDFYSEEHADLIEYNAHNSNKKTPDQ